MCFDAIFLKRRRFVWHIHRLELLYWNPVFKGNNRNVNQDPITWNPTRLNICLRLYKRKVVWMNTINWWWIKPISGAVSPPYSTVRKQFISEWPNVTECEATEIGATVHASSVSVLSTRAKTVFSSIRMLICKMSFSLSECRLHSDRIGAHIRWGFSKKAGFIVDLTSNWFSIEVY